MVVKNITALTLLLTTVFFCNAQKKVIYNNQQWFQYLNQLRFSERLTLHTDISLRRINDFNDWSQITFRTGLGYSLTQNLQGITGIACFTSYTQNKLSRIELRPYQEINSTQTFGKVSIQHRFRIEARYFRKVSEGEITDTSNFNFRFRYRLYSSTTILQLSEAKQDRKLLLNIGDEIFINAGKEIVYNVFDNNRFLAGVTYQHSNNLSFTFGYINQFGQRSLPATYENSDILTLAISQKISLQKTAAKSP
jgi:hypothetical protein